MCGISGIVAKRRSAGDRARLQKVNNLIAHRGPDDEGFYFAEGLALGHRRLSILDLGRRGHQPMCYLDRYWITYNGEVYNYIELKEELQRQGFQFSTTTDTEVILAAYAAWGPRCLPKFNGMWAFAIYDAVDKQLFLARDRFGIKPLYYTDAPDEFAFGSELKQMVELRGRARANQRVVVEALLTHFEGHTDQTFFAGVNNLPQGHYLTYHLGSHSYSIERYYELQVDSALASLSLEEATHEFRELLADAIRIRLRSDVSVGTCLSGGLDSSAISAIAGRLYHSQTGRRFGAIHAKSVEARSDESAHAIQVAEDADLAISIVEPSFDDFANQVDEVVYTQEEPFGSPSMFMGWHVFREAKRRKCKVMLNGQGGDEVLLGYERYYAAFLKTLTVVRLLKEARLQSHNSRLNLLEPFLYYFYFTNPGLRIRRLKRRSLLRPDIKRCHDFEYVRLSARSFRELDRLQILEISSLQLPHLLRYEDRNSMRHSVETRLPFLDYRLVELGVSLPFDYKIRDGWTKYLMRRAVAPDMPRGIVWRKNKLGFQAPERTWLTAYEAEMKREIAKSDILQEITDRKRLLEGFSALSLRERWAYFNLAAWERVYDVQWA